VPERQPEYNLSIWVSGVLFVGCPPAAIATRIRCILFHAANLAHDQSSMLQHRNVPTLAGTTTVTAMPTMAVRLDQPSNSPIVHSMNAEAAALLSKLVLHRKLASV
jgi:hypothetical protein